MTSLDAEATFTLDAVFGRLGYPVRADHDYFVDEPPAALDLDASSLRALEVRAPFFVDHGWSFGPNSDLVPFVWDRSVGGQARFSEGEALTDYDSGLFGLCSVSAPADEQAQLYRTVGRSIVDVHRANRELLGEWLEAQGSSSTDAFMYFDRERFPAEEKLLAADGSIDRALWDTRLDELTACLSQDAFRKHHFRWIEFLAHAVDVPRLMGLVRGAQRS